MLVHGVQGELLTQNRLLVPLAAACRECCYCLPRCASAPSALVAHRATPPSPVVSRRFPAKRHHVGSAAASVSHCFGPSSRNVCRILSIEPLISGAGKEGAYYGPGRSAADYLAGGCGAFRTAPRWRMRSMKALATCAMLRRKSMSSVAANGAGALRSTTARAQPTRGRRGSNVNER